MNEKLERFQREMESQNEEDGNAVDIRHEQLNTIQENLTKVNEETVEDLPFSKFLVPF